MPEVVQHILELERYEHFVFDDEYPCSHCVIDGLFPLKYDGNGNATSLQKTQQACIGCALSVDVRPSESAACPRPKTPRGKKPMNAALLSLTIAALAPAALAPAAAAAQDDPIEATYTCTGGQTLDVVFTDGKATVTPKGGQPLALTQAMTADGFEYRDAHHSLRGRGDDATWSVHGAEPLNCTAGDGERG
jgi:membrane-bound inhibitor of C-type lysozyme